MKNIWNLTKSVIADEGGAALIEYTVLLGVMMILSIATVLSVGNWVNLKWVALNTNLSP